MLGVFKFEKHLNAQRVKKKLTSQHFGDIILLRLTGQFRCREQEKTHITVKLYHDSNNNATVFLFLPKNIFVICCVCRDGAGANSVFFESVFYIGLKSALCE